MKVPKNRYTYYVFQPEKSGIWIRRISGAADGCRQYLEGVKKLYPHAFYKAVCDVDLCNQISTQYAAGYGGNLLKIENYFCKILMEEK